MKPGPKLLWFHMPRITSHIYFQRVVVSIQCSCSALAWALVSIILRVVDISLCIFLAGFWQGKSVASFAYRSTSASSFHVGFGFDKQTTCPEAQCTQNFYHNIPSCALNCMCHLFFVTHTFYGSGLTMAEARSMERIGALLPQSSLFLQRLLQVG